MFRCLSIGLLTSSIISAPLPAKALECPPGYVREVMYVPTCVAKPAPLTKEEKARLSKPLNMKRYIDLTEKEKDIIQQELNKKAKTLECPPGYVREVMYVPTCVAKPAPLTKEEKARLSKPLNMKRYID